jgi:phosphotransferase system  glucose/maltose/N-acetylglucosamine-specific IIC component
MWSSVAVLALLAALNPVRLGLALLVISRPRPVQNLLAFWVGCLTASIAILLAPLIALHVTPMLRPLVQNLASPSTVASSTVRHIQIGMGVFALSIAALTIVRFFARQRTDLPTKGGNTATLTVDSNTPAAVKRLMGGPQDAPTEGKSAIRRLPGRARNAWANGALWVALMIGLGSGPSPDGVLYVLAIIVPSGAAIGTQVSAAIAFVVGMLVVVEIMLVCYLATPAKTHAVVQLLHDWVLAHRRQVLIAVCTVAGVSLVAQGMGSS